MLIEIFDVDHGFCALVTADDGQHVLLDCGRNSRTGLSPSGILYARGIRQLEALIVSHADEDHVSDLPALGRAVNVRSLIANDTLAGSTLQNLKAASGEVGLGAQEVIWRTNRYLVALTGGVSYPVLPQAELAYFRNPYPSFSNLNNLSLVTFLHYGDIHIVFPGDLEAAGWRSLLQYPDFRAHLTRVNVFVASHHGRENGFCEEVFAFCRPEIVIISDCGIRHASQEMTDTYASRALGVRIGFERRKVLTTRCDGTIKIWQSLPDNSGAWIASERSLRRSLPRPALYLP
jgi:beta-lactamase superfamily II metal-dependent hydrolase